MFFRKMVLAILAGFVAPASAFATTILYDGDGKVSGIAGLPGLNPAFNIRFVDGSCASLFNGCQTSSDFPPELGAELFVVMNILPGVVTDPSQIAGCSSSESCMIYFPWVTDPSLSYTINRYVLFNTIHQPGFTGWSGGGATILDRNLDTGAMANATYAVLESAAVPEPATWLIMLAGLAMAGGLLRRRKPVSPHRAPN
jgi:hypothetical protein